MPANITSKPLRDLLASVDSNELVLPEIQRDFVWSRKAVMLLFDSLYRGLPIGHMLVWKARFNITTKAFAHKNKPKGTTRDNFYGYILDGQQRLTAVSRVRDRDDDYRLLFNLWPDEAAEGDDNELFYWWGSWAENEGPWSISVAEVLDPDFKPMTHLAALRQDEAFKPAYEEPAFNKLTALQRILDYPVGITEWESDSYREASELFIRFNSTGKRLSKSDLAMAELAIQVPGLGAGQISAATRRWAPAFQFTRPFLIQCLAAVNTGGIIVKTPKDFWAKSSARDIHKSWEATEKAISELIELLTGVVRWDSSLWLPSFNALIPIIFVLAKGPKLTGEDRELVRTWLILSTVRSYFSGSFYPLLDRVLKKLESKPTMKQLWSITKKRLRRLSPDDFSTGRMSSPVMSLFVSMIRASDAKDWKLSTPLNGTVRGHNAGLHIHHFFPRALLRKEGYDAAMIDSFANYTLLSAATNLAISTEEPWTYLRREKIEDRHLEQQCIPLDQSLWRVDRYEDFLGERRKLLSRAANVFLGLEKG